MLSTSQQTEVTRLLAALHAGDANAADRLLPLVYNELRRAAARLLSAERAGHTFTPTDLVHEAWLRLGLSPVGDAPPVPAENRAHFLGITIRAMRQVLIDHARRRIADKRGAGAIQVTFDEQFGARATSPDELLALLDAIERLGAIDPRLRQVVEHRYLAGLTEEETASVLQVTTRTVQRDWVKARAWLYRQLYESVKA